MLIHRDALVVHELTTDSDNRYFLSGVLIDKEGRAVATDGHMLVRFTGTPSSEAFTAIDGVADVTTAEDTIVTRDDLRAALATMGKSLGDDNRLAVVSNGKHVTIATARHDRTVQIKARKVEGTFPDYERVMKFREKPVVARVIIDAAFLETLGRMIKKAGGKAVTLTLHGEAVDVMEPVFVSAKCANGEIDGAIMPMRA